MTAAANWVVDHPFQSHVLVPGSLTLALIGMYFSGLGWLQAIVAPSIQGVEPFSQREFGALEMAQNVVLVLILYCEVRCYQAARSAAERALILLLMAATFFQFVEEIDYGAHFVELLSGVNLSAGSGTWERNIHNLPLADGTQVASLLKLAATLVIAVGFVLAPLLRSRVRHRGLRKWIPSTWCIATVAIMFATARLAHWLDDLGFGIIDGEQGNLYLNISEFRELNLYLLILLYVLSLFQRLTANPPGGQQTGAG